MSDNVWSGTYAEKDMPELRRDGATLRQSRLPLFMRLFAWSAGLALALAFFLAWQPGSPVVNDFTQNVWLPARLLLDGTDLYNPTRAQVDTSLGEYSSQIAGFNSGKDYNFIYPAWVAALFAPFAAIPLALSLAVWRALNLLLLVWGIGALLRYTNPSFRVLRPASIAALGLTFLLCLIYREAVLTLIIGQFSIILFGLLAAIWGWLVSSRNLSGRQRLAGDVLTGLALAVLATKPQAVGLPVVLVGLWAISRRRWAIPLASVASLLLLLLLPIIFYPASLTNWLDITFSGQAASQVKYSASVWGISYQWLGSESPWIAVALVLTLAGLAVLIPRWLADFRDGSSPVPLSLPLTVCINSVVSPYMLGYEHVLLLMPALILLAAAGLPDDNVALRSRASRKGWRLAVYTWLGVLPWLVVIVQAALDKEYPAIAQSAPMLALCWLARLRWTRET